MSYEAPMFPLGTALLPGGLLPLHVFEHRYRMMIERVLAGDREFGVVLIERGAETGGDDVRTSVGTIAEVLEAAELDDGRWVLEVVGRRRIRVLEWLTTDSHPKAIVEDWPDEPGDPVSEAVIARCAAELRTSLALAAELGARVDPDPRIGSDPTIAGYQIGVLAPFGSFDRQNVLSAATVSARFELLGELLAEQQLLLRARLDA